MSNYALFSALFYPNPTPSPYMVFSADRLNVTCPATSDGTGTAFVASQRATGKYRFQWQYGQTAGDNPGGQAFLGFGDASTSLTAGTTYAPNAVGINTANGNMYTTNGSGAQTLYNAFGSALSIGDYVLGVFDADTNQVWFNIIYSGVLQQWNGNGPSANPDTGVGGLTITNITDYIPIVQAQLGLTTGGVYINTGSSPYQPGMPTTFLDLPATLELTGGPTAYVGAKGKFTWVDSNCGTLQYILDGAGPANALGTTTGAGGTATTAGTFGTVQSHSFALTDGANPLDLTPSVPFWTPLDPGSGAVLVSQRGTLQGSGTGTKTASGTFTPSSYIEFDLLLNEVYTYLTSGIPFDPTFRLYGDAAQTDILFTISADGDASGNVAGSVNLQGGTVPPTSGSNSWTVSGAWGSQGDVVSSLVSGTIDITSIVGTIAVGNVIVDHPSGSCTWTSVNIGTTTATTVDCLQGWYIADTTGFLDYGLSIYGASPPPPESNVVYAQLNCVIS